VTVPQPSIPAIASVFFRIGLLSFGGGLTGWVYREVVQTRGWMAEDEFLSGMAVSQILPGANIANLAVYVGNRLKGPLGAAAALGALLIGPFFAVLALASAYGLIKGLAYAQTALEGVAAAAIGLLLLVVLRGARRAARRPAALLAFLATFVGVALMHLSLPLVVIIVGPLSVAAAWPRGADA